MVACLNLAQETPPGVTVEGHPQHNAEGADPNALTPLPLPEELPFTARTRTLPCTIVDRHGAPLEVLTALGVEVEVKRLLSTRALITCSGCREPVDGWVQRQALFVGTVPADGEHDAFLATLKPGVTPQGFVQDEEQWIAAP